MFQKFKGVVVGLVTVAIPSMAFADAVTAPTLPTTVDLTYYFALLTLVLAALALLWPARKSIKLMNRS